MDKNKIDSWDSYCGKNSFLKVENVKGENDAFAVTEVSEFIGDDGNAKPRIIVEKGSESYIFDLNVTNSNFCKNAGIQNPKSLVGKKMYFKIVLARNPKLKTEVESLRIAKIV